MDGEYQAHIDASMLNDWSDPIGPFKSPPFTRRPPLLISGAVAGISQPLTYSEPWFMTPSWRVSAAQEAPHSCDRNDQGCYTLLTQAA